MAKTLLARISRLEQYNAAEKTLLWDDPSETRWQNAYGQIRENDSAIFIAGDKLFIGNVSQVNFGKSIFCNNITEVECSNDQFLQLHEAYPELISRVKAAFQPFIHPEKLNIEKLIDDAQNQRFISYYIFRSTEIYNQQKSTLKANDRLALIESSGQFGEVKIQSSEGPADFPAGLNIHPGVKGYTLEKMLEINKGIKRKSAKSNNVARIENIITSLKTNGSYRFNTFFSYYDALFNKRVYRNGENKIFLEPGEIVYKVSMSGKPDEIDEEAFTYFNDNNLIVVNSKTKAKGVTRETQGEAFSKRMKVGDYFYLCRGNSNLEIIGRIATDAEKCEYGEYGTNNYLQRSYEIISEAIRDDPYKNKQKWWTPNDNSTCIAIPQLEMDDANKWLFQPFFNAKFEYRSISNPPKYMDKSLNRILYGPPGTGKTYNTVNKAISIIENIDEESLISRYTDRAALKKRFDNLLIKDWENPTGQIAFVTFHQSMSYEDFIEGIKPGLNDQSLTYDIENGIFKNIAKIARDNWFDAEKGITEELFFRRCLLETKR